MVESVTSAKIKTLLLDAPGGLAQLSGRLSSLYVVLRRSRGAADLSSGIGLSDRIWTHAWTPHRRRRVESSDARVLHRARHSHKRNWDIREHGGTTCCGSPSFREFWNTRKEPLAAVRHWRTPWRRQDRWSLRPDPSLNVGGMLEVDGSRDTVACSLPIFSARSARACERRAPRAFRARTERCT